MQPRVFNNQPPQAPDQPVPQACGEGVIEQQTGFPQESFIVKYCQARNSAFQQWFDSYIKSIAEWHRISKNLIITPKAQAGVALPVGSGIVESINARLQPALLNRSKVVEAMPDFPTEDNESTAKIEDFVNQQVLIQSRTPERGKQAIKSAIVESFIIWRNLWKQETIKKVVPVPIPDPNFNPMAFPPGTPQPIIGSEDKIVEEQRGFWTWELKNPANVAWDAHTITHISQSPWVRERSQMSFNQLMALQREGVFKDVERLRFVVPKGAGGTLKTGWEEEIRRADGDSNWSFTYADEKSFEVEEWWADLSWKDGENHITKKMRWFLVEGNFVFGLEENPLIPQRIPYDSCPFVLDIHSLTGQSAIGTISGIQSQINNMAGYQAMLTERLAKPTIFYDESSGLSNRTSFFKMYGMQPVQNVQGIREMVMDSGPVAAVQAYINFLIGLAREASGANEQFQGVEGADTLGEFQGLAAAAGQRFADTVDTLSQGWLERLATECFLFTRQFVNDGDAVVRAANTEGRAEILSRADFAADYTFIAASSSNEQSKQKEIQAVTQAMEISSKMGPSADGKVLNTQKIWEEILLPMLGQKNGADWFIQAPMAPPMGIPGMPPPPGGAGEPIPPPEGVA